MNELQPQRPNASHQFSPSIVTHMPPKVITHGPSLTAFPSDILSEILSYFRYGVMHGISEWPNEVEEYWQTRKTVLAIALVACKLSAIALDTLWRDMLSLQPILKVIEASASSPIFHFRNTPGRNAGEGQWERTDDHPNFDQMLLRVESYLPRVKHLEIANPSTKEYTLWSILVSYLKHNGPLLPELRMLRVEWDFPDLPIYPTLFPLISSTLQKLELFSPDNEDFYGEPIIHHLHLMGGNPRSLSLTGYSQKSLLPILRSFSSLRELWLQSPGKKLPINRTFSVQELLLALPTLRSLMLDLSAVHLNSGQPPVFTETTIQTLYVAGCPRDIICFFENDIRPSSVKELDIFILGSRLSLSWKNIFQVISCAFPKLCCLRFDHSRIEHAPSICIGDLVPTFKRSLTRLTLSQIKYLFSSADVNSMLQAWSRLQFLDLGPGVKFDATVLEYIAGHGLLESIVLSVDLSDFIDPAAGAMDFAKKPTHKQPHLTKLSIRQPSVLPTTFEQKVTLVRGLSTLFPRLECVSFFSDPAYVGIERELRVLLSTFRTVYQDGYCVGVGEKNA